MTARDTIAAELQKLTDRVKVMEPNSDNFAELGAELLRIAALIAHVDGFSQEIFAGMARLAWRDVKRKRIQAN